MDPYRLCSDPDPGSHVHPDLDPALYPNGIRINSDLDLTKSSHFFKSKDLTVVTLIFMVHRTEVLLLSTGNFNVSICVLRDKS